MIESKISEKLARQVDLSFDTQLGFLARLVSIKSLPGHEREGQLFCAQTYRTLGMEVEIFEAEKAEIKSHHAYVDTGLGYTVDLTLSHGFKKLGRAAH